MKPAPFEYVAASSLDEVIGILCDDEDAKVLAGGQSLLPLLALRLARPSVLVDIAGLGLDHLVIRAGDSGGSGSGAGRSTGAEDDVGELRLGALVSQRRLELDPQVRAAAPLLAEAAAQVGYPATRNRGTLGGSLAHADPAAELPAVAVALDGVAVIHGPAGARLCPAAQLATGFLTTDVAVDEVLVEVRLRRAGPGHGAAWCEWSPRRHDFAEAGVGVAVELDGDGCCSWLGAAACGVAAVPVDLRPALVAAGVPGARAVDSGLLRSVAAAVSAACAGERVALDEAASAGAASVGAELAGAGGDRAELAGALAAKAVRLAFERAAEDRL